MNPTTVPILKSSPVHQVYFFDVFIGEPDPFGRIRKIRSIGRAIHGDGQKTYTLQLKTFLNFDFYLLKEANRKGIDYSLFTRESMQNHSDGGNKFFWHMVGEAKLLAGTNAGLLALKWDLFSSDNIYMSMHPKVVRDGSTVPAQMS